MKPLSLFLRQLDRRFILIYIFSYLIYLGINKVFSISLLSLLGEESFNQRWTNFSTPCKDTPHTFIVLFQIFKLALFGLLLNLAKTQKKAMLQEILIAYFIFDFVYVLSFIWDLIPFPIRLNSWWTLISTGQIFLSRYFQYLDVVFAGFWTLALFFFLYKQKKLLASMVAIRLILIALTVPVYYFLMYLLLYKH